MDIVQNGTHFMTFQHSQAGVTFPSWTRKLLKGGELRTDIDIQMRETAAGLYTFAFVNDGEAESIWTLCVNVTGDTSNYYIETWKVAPTRTEEAVEQLTVTIQGMSSGGGLSGSPGPLVGKS